MKLIPRSVLVRFFVIGVLIFGGYPSALGFGKNKIAYQTFQWKKHDTDHFELYYYPESAAAIPEVASFFEKAYARISNDLGTDLSDKTPVIVYKTKREFQQTNILAGFIPKGVAGFSEPIKRRIVIPLEGSHRELELLIIHELVHTFEFEILFQNRFNRISSVPLWVMEGFSEHIANDWNATGRMVLRDAVINNLIPSLENLNTFDQLYNAYLGYKISQSAVDYLRKNYGITKFRSLLWEMRKTLRTENYFEKAVKEVYGKSLNQISLRWEDDLRRRVIELERRREGVSNYQEVIGDLKQYHRRSSPAYCSGGELIAYIESGIDGIHVYQGSLDSEKPDVFSCLTCDLDAFRYRQFIMEGRPLGGNPWSDRLVYLSTYENRVYANVLEPALGGFSMSLPLPVDHASSPALSPDGDKIAISAFSNAQSDIYIFDLNSEEIRQLTFDGFIDETPCWSPDGQWIVYSTEREDQFDLYRVPSEGGTPEPMIKSLGNETSPAWSPDGKYIVYISDRIDGVNDLYLMTVENAKVVRLAAPVTGMFNPSFSTDGQSIAVSFFYNASEKIVTLPIDRELEIPDIAKDAPMLGVDGESTPFKFGESTPAGDIPQTESDLQNQKVKFRLIPDMAIGQIGYGSDGDFSVEGGVIMSDVLGDHQFELVGVRRGDRNGVRLNYRYLKHRWNLEVYGLQDTDYYYIYSSTKNRYYERQWNYYGIESAFQYPHNTFLRSELRLGHFTRDYQTDIPNSQDYQEQICYLEPLLIGDTTRYRPLTGYMEPYSGQRFQIGIQIPFHFNNKYQKFFNSTYDYRAYIPLTRRSLFAFREWGIFSLNDEPEFFGVGGYNTLRGYGYNTLVGNYVAISNIELRFPLVDYIIFPGGLAFHGFRGKIFVDTAAVWLKGEDKTWKVDDPETREQEGNIFASIGAGFNFWLIGAEWHFEWGQKTDFKSFKGDYVYQWSIKRSF